MSPGSPQEVARRERALLGSPLWHERQARQMRESAARCDALGQVAVANEYLRRARQLEIIAETLRANGRPA